jgi:hypothetical protein
MPDAGPLELQPERVAPALIVERAAAPAIDTFKKSRLSARMESEESPKMSLGVQHKKAPDQP